MYTIAHTLPIELNEAEKDESIFIHYYTLLVIARCWRFVSRRIDYASEEKNRLFVSHAWTGVLSFCLPNRLRCRLIGGYERKHQRV